MLKRTVPSLCVFPLIDVKGHAYVKRLLILLAVLLVPSLSVAQTVSDVCSSGVQPFVVQSGAPFAVTFVIPTMVPISDTDPRLVPARINGYTVSIDGGVKVDVAPAPVGAAICPDGTPFAGQQPLAFRTVSGVAKGSHTLTLASWNFKLDSLGNPTSERQEAAVSLPFVAADPVQQGPPPLPKNLIIRK